MNVGTENTRRKRMNKIKIDSIVSLKDGLRGKVVGQMVSGEYPLEYGKGGRIIYFTEEDVKEETNEN